MKTQPANPQPTPTNHFTNFTEISYEKTRNSYDQCEAPPLATSVRPALQSVRPEPKSKDPIPPSARQSGSPEWAEMGRNDPDFQFFRP